MTIDLSKRLKRATKAVSEGVQNRLSTLLAAANKFSPAKPSVLEFTIASNASLTKQILKSLKPLDVRKKSLHRGWGQWGLLTFSNALKTHSRSSSRHVSRKQTSSKHSRPAYRQTVQKRADRNTQRSIYARQQPISKPAPFKLRKVAHKDIKTPVTVREMDKSPLSFRDRAEMRVKLSSLDSIAFSARHVAGQTVDTRSTIHTARTLAKTTIEETIIHDDALAEVLRPTFMKSQHRLAVQASKFVKIRTMRRAIDTHIVRPLIWSGMRAIMMTRQPASRSTQRSLTVPTKRPMQNTVGMPMATVPGNRATSGHEIFVQRGNGLRVQTSNASAALAIAGQQHGGKQGKSPVMSAAARWNPAIAMRGAGRANPALAYPAPIIMQPIERIINPDIQINDRLYSIIDQVDPDIGEELLACIMEQLQEGPASLANDDIRIRANSILPANIAWIDGDSWKALLQETLVIVFQNVLPFDGHGMRKRETLYADAALILDIDENLFAQWEACFSIDCLSENITEGGESSTRFVQEQYENLVMALTEQLGIRANAALTPSNYQDAIIHSFETEAQWTAARFCAIPESRSKVITTLSHLTKLVKKDKITAARILALIVSYSGISRRPATSAPVPRWSKEELQSLVEGLTRHAPSLLTNSQFRSQLTSWENKAFNQLIHRVNHENSMDQLRKLSPKEPFEAFFDLLEKAGQEDEVLHDIWQDMARNLAKLN